MCNSKINILNLNGPVFLAVFPLAACPGGWKIFEKNCYKKFPGKKSWDDAVLACEGKKAALAEVLSQGENDFIQKQIGGNAWIGVTRCHTSSTCILDYTPAYYRNWAPGQPDKKPQITLGMQNNEFAVFMKGNGKWDDEPKQKGYDYICKKPGTCSSSAQLWSNRFFARPIWISR